MTKRLTKQDRDMLNRRTLRLFQEKLTHYRAKWGEPARQEAFLSMWRATKAEVQATENFRRDPSNWIQRELPLWMPSTGEH